MKDYAIVDDYVIDEIERVHWVGIIYVSDGHQIFKASFISCIGGVKVTEQDSLIPKEIIVLMSTEAIEFFKKHKVFRSAPALLGPAQVQAEMQDILPFEEKSP